MYGLHAGQEIVKEPSSLLLPVNKIGVFSCKALCESYQCLGFWVVNDSVSDFQNNTVPGMYYRFQGNMTAGYTLTLTVNASEALNNTRIRCRYEPGGNRDGQHPHSTTAYLLVVTSTCPIKYSVAKQKCNYQLII